MVRRGQKKSVSKLHKKQKEAVISQREKKLNPY